MARLGAKAFFEMLMKNNFIHADCHGGNLLISLQKHDSSFFSEISQYVLEHIQKIEEFITERAIPH